MVEVKNNSSSNNNSSTTDTLDISDFPLTSRLNGSMDKCTMLLSKLTKLANQPTVTLESSQTNRNISNQKRSKAKNRKSSNIHTNPNRKKRICHPYWLVPKENVNSNVNVYFFKQPTTKTTITIIYKFHIQLFIW